MKHLILFVENEFMTEASREAKHVKVWNDNIHPFKQKFKDRLIVIPSKEHIVMEFYEGHEFKSFPSPVKLDADDNPLPISYKMLRLENHFPEDRENIPEGKKEEVSNDCLACGKKFFLAEELTEHLKEHTSKTYNPDVAEMASQSKKNKDVYPKV
jgi:hypothetical protein